MLLSAIAGWSCCLGGLQQAVYAGGICRGRGREGQVLGTEGSFSSKETLKSAADMTVLNKRSIQEGSCSNKEALLERGRHDSF